VSPPLLPGPSGYRRSSYCATAGCVEVAALPGDQIAVRDSKDMRPDAPHLIFSVTEWKAFLSGVIAGEFSAVALSQPNDQVTALVT
jgi:Domain of unknown function (DUF397)